MTAILLRGSASSMRREPQTASHGALVGVALLCGLVLAVVNVEQPNNLVPPPPAQKENSRARLRMVRTRRRSKGASYDTRSLEIVDNSAAILSRSDDVKLI